jgi:hypothetical protein
MRACKSVITVALVIGPLTGGTQTYAQSKTWTEQGPGPILNDGNTVLPNMSPVAGAINAIVPSPSSADVIYAGTVNGGVWKTSNATAASPTWIPLTDPSTDPLFADKKLPELSMKSLAMSPVNSNTLFAGTGSTSSLADRGSRGIGVARSTDGGSTWSVLAGTTFKDKIITSIVPTTLNEGNTILAATWPDSGGVYRSTDNGETFTRISGNGASGLPNGGVTSLIADPANPNRFYAGVLAGHFSGVYRSTNGGTVWLKVSTGITGLSTALRILLTIHNDPTNNVVYAAVINEKAGLGGVFRTTNQGLRWTSLGVPNPPIYPRADTEGGQGSIHGAIAADPSNPNVVFISGDAQGSQQNFSPFPPNANGCTTFSGNGFRYTGTAWENVVCSGASGTSPHADSRFMTFDANGNLLQANDGGIARLVNPNTPATRSWVSLVGTNIDSQSPGIKSVEFHSVAYDPVSNVVFGGAQDNGVSYQIPASPASPSGFTWNQLLGGDGGVVGVDADQVSHTGESLRYTSSQMLGGFNRTTWDATNTMIGGFIDVGLNIKMPDGTETLFQFEGDRIPFYPPFALNAIDPSRMLIGTAHLYESLDRGDSLTILHSFGTSVVGSGAGRPIVYGGRLNGLPVPDVFYVGAGNRIFHRVTKSGPITELKGYEKIGGGPIVTIAMDPNNYRQVYVSDTNNKVWASSDEGATWADLTATLGKLTSQVTTIEIFSPLFGTPTLYAGGFGVFQLTNPTTAGGQWTAVTGPPPDNNKIPPALVLDLHYDYTKNVLVAGTLGRGAWLFGAPPTTAVASAPGGGSSVLASTTAAKNSRPPVARPAAVHSINLPSMR